MNFNYWDLGNQAERTAVRVALEGNSANVRLLDHSNYRSFQAGQQHHYYGAHYNTSPVMLRLPNAGHWYVVIDYGGLAGRGRAAVQVLGV